MTSSPREPGDSGDAADAPLVEAAPMVSHPAHRGKQLVLGIAGVVLAIALFVPWWDAEIPLDRVAATLNAWLLLVTGLSIGDLGSTTGYSWFGNALFGLVPVVPVVVLIVLIALRVSRTLVTPANTMFVYSLLAAVGALWMFLFGAMRVDASNGVYPVLAGPWIVLVVGLALGVLCLGWWRLERVHFPKRRRRVFGAARSADAAAREDDTGNPFADIDFADARDDDPMAFGDDLGEGEPGDDAPPPRDR